jgi:hypothetical protein
MRLNAAVGATKEENCIYFHRKYFTKLAETNANATNKSALSLRMANERYRKCYNHFYRLDCGLT